MGTGGVPKIVRPGGVMSQFKIRPIILVVTIYLLGGSLALAQGDMQAALIQKLEIVYKNLAPQDPQRPAISLRLADLISEQARVIGQTEFDQTGNFGQTSMDLRIKARQIYSDTLPSLSGSQKARVLLQMGYLSELLQESSKAQASFLQVTQLTTDPSVQGEAQLALAENYFRGRQFAQAIPAYEKALSLPIARKGYALFRKSWSAYNMGQVEQAVQGLERILDTPSFLSMAGRANNELDLEFLNEVARDYAIFLVKQGDLSAEKVQAFAKRVSKGDLQDHLKQLGFEAQRSGNNAASVVVWRYFYNQSTAPADRVMALTQEAMAQWALQNRVLAKERLEQSLREWASVPGGCLAAVCEESQKLARQMIVNWHQSEKLKPSADLAVLYRAYLSAHGQDIEMSEWLAQIYEAQSKWPEAQAQYLATSQLVKEPAATERLLLLMLAIGEKSNDPLLQSKVWSQYLESTSVRSQYYQVLYLKNKALYDAKNFALAQPALADFAKDEAAPGDLRLLSAHLHLDALAEQKLDQMLIDQSQKYAQSFAKNSSEFINIKNKAILNFVAQVGAQDPSQSLQMMAQNLDSQSLAPTERLVYLKNKAILAEKAGNFALAAQTVLELGQHPEINADDKLWALKKQIWFAELRLDFMGVYEGLKKLEDVSSEHFLKLALFAELAGQNPEKYFEKVLAQTEDLELKKRIYFELLERKKDQFAWITANRAWLGAKDPDALAKSYVIAQAKLGAGSQLKATLKGIDKKSAWGSLLWRYQYLQEYQVIEANTRGHQLDVSSDGVMQKTIRARAKLLQDLEKFANQSIQAQDWSAQILTLGAVASENQRFYQDLMSLPMPEGLTPDEESQYMQMLMQQAQPYANKAAEVKAKVTELWQRSSWDKAYQESLEKAPETSPLFALELGLLKAAAENEDQIKIDQILAQMAKPTRLISSEKHQSLASAREQLRANPLDKVAHQNLIHAEREVGNTAMAQYLEMRMQNLDSMKEIQ